MNTAIHEPVAVHNPNMFPPSVLGASWEIAAPDMREVLTLVQQFELPEIVARLLINRGVTTQTAADYLDPSLKNLMPDPNHFLDMDKAAERLAKAIICRENIAIFGDYDVDGATSSALLFRFLRMVGAPAQQVYIPDRLSEGYGLNTEALLALRKRGAAVLVTVDCGTVSHEPIKAARDAGLEVIVIDHHLGGEELPPALAVVNPNRLDEASPHRYLAAVGMTFLLITAVRGVLREKGYFAANPPEPDIRNLLDLVALGTVCDMVPLIGVNRAFVDRGLKILQQRTNLGLATLADQAGITSAPSVYHCGFLLGPRINAGGRVGTSDLGFRLLSTEDSEEARTLAAQLDTLNRERQAVEQQVMAEAMMLAIAADPDSPMLCIASEGWHQGVIGIVAGRLKETFGKPVAVIALENGIGKASARSISGVDLGSVITEARMKGLIPAGGGHAMAAGFTVEQSRLPTLQHFLNERLRKDIARLGGRKKLSLDGILNLSAVTPALAKAVERAAPYGIGNREPRFVFQQVRVIEASIVGEKHVRCILGSGGPNPDKRTRIKAIAFQAMDTPLGKILQKGYSQELHLAGKLKRDSWQGTERAEITIEDAVVAG